MPKKKEASIRVGPGCSIFQLGPNWYIRFYNPRRKPARKKQALKTADRSEALRLGTALYNKWVNDEDPFDPWAGHTTRARFDATPDEVLEDYQQDRAVTLRPSSLKHILWLIDWFFRETRIEWLSQVKPRHVRRFVYRADVSQATRLNYWSNLNVFFNWCEKNLYLDENPCAKVDKPKDYKPHPHAMTEQDVDRLLTAIEVHIETCKAIHRKMLNQLWMRDALDLMAGAGLRPAELRRLRWGDIEWPITEPTTGRLVMPGRLHIREHDGEQTKSGERRYVTMLPRAQSRLDYLQTETRLSNNPKEHVLKGPDGHSPIATSYLSRRFRLFRDKAGLPSDYHLYSLRHFFATELARRGCSATLLQKEMGHKDYSTTQKYLHVADAERHRATFALFTGQEKVHR